MENVQSWWFSRNMVEKHCSKIINKSVWAINLLFGYARNTQLNQHAMLNWFTYVTSAGPIWFAAVGVFDTNWETRKA